MPQGVERRILILRLPAERDAMKSINKPQGGKGLVFLSNDPTLGNQFPALCILGSRASGMTYFRKLYTLLVYF
jgi:hypothetical protein